MNPQLTVFGPVFALAFWTFIVLNVLGFRRIRAGRQRRVKPEDFKLGESDQVPEQVRLANRNYMNLLELPVLFYVVSLTVFVTGAVTSVIVATSWFFVLLRVAHSIIHITTNNVLLRLYVFVVMWMILWATRSRTKNQEVATIIDVPAPVTKTVNETT